MSTLSHDISRLKLAVNIACYEFSSVVVWLVVFYYLFVCEYCIEFGHLNRLNLHVHFTLFWCKLLSLKGALVYSDLTHYLVIPLGVLIRIPVSAKTHVLILCIEIHQAPLRMSVLSGESY